VKVNVISVEDKPAGVLVVPIESILLGGILCGCGSLVSVKERPVVRLVDLPAFGRPTRLWWRKHRLVYRAKCGLASRMWTDERIAHARQRMTTRAGRWGTRQVGQYGRTVAEVARELGCDWHTTNDRVISYRTPLVDEPGADRDGHRVWATQLVHVKAGQVIDVVEAMDTTHGPVVSDSGLLPRFRSGGSRFVSRSSVANNQPRSPPWFWFVVAVCVLLLSVRES
jgi:hypothetical protein